MSKLTHSKAYIYTSERISYDNKMCKFTNVIALDPDIDINDLIRKWNLLGKEHYNYVLEKEIPVKEAIHLKSPTGNTIYSSWQLLPDLPYHSVPIKLEVQEILN